MFVGSERVMIYKDKFKIQIKINREYNKKWNELYRIKSEVEYREKR